MLLFNPSSLLQKLVSQAEESNLSRMMLSLGTEDQLLLEAKGLPSFCSFMRTAPL